MRHYTIAECSRIFEALGFTADDSFYLTVGWNSSVIYYNQHLNAAMRELGL